MQGFLAFPPELTASPLPSRFLPFIGIADGVWDFPATAYVARCLPCLAPAITGDSAGWDNGLESDSRIWAHSSQTRRLIFPDSKVTGNGFRWWQRRQLDRLMLEIVRLTGSLWNRTGV